jgi:hypothetical protein
MKLVSKTGDWKMSSIKIKMPYDCTIVVPADGEGFGLLSVLSEAAICREEYGADYKNTYLVRQKTKLAIEVGDYEVLDAKPVEPEVEEVTDTPST